MCDTTVLLDDDASDFWRMAEWFKAVLLKLINQPTCLPAGKPTAPVRLSDCEAVIRSLIELAGHVVNKVVPSRKRTSMAEANKSRQKRRLGMRVRTEFLLTAVIPAKALDFPPLRLRRGSA
jgi:hypothetical protein